MESFLEEMKRYLGFSEADARLLRLLGPRMEKYLPEMADRFYARIFEHPDARRVFTGGEAQMARLKITLQDWARGLFRGPFDEAYEASRYEIGLRHVRTGVEQRYVISAMGIVRAFLAESLLREFQASDERLLYARSLGKILDLDLNLICESYFRNTTESLRLANQQLERATLQLAEACRIKDEFLAHVSHELRTPLNSVLGFIKLILDGVCKDAAEERELLRDAFSSAQHLLGIVNDLLDIGRIEAGQLSLNLKAIYPRQILDSTLPLVAVQAAGKKLALRDETLDGTLPQVLADELRLRQVLLNLLSNAVKFTPQGAVMLRARPDCPEGYLRLEIEDTGVGIPPDQRETVFEEFVQVRGDEGRRQVGAGLGLTIARRLVELMGGRIGIETPASGAGALVWFTLPLAATPEVAPAATPSRSTATRAAS